MGVYIKGMEMPKSCYECRFAFDGMCIANRGRKDVGIANSCPLIEVPKHGRLIDADALVTASHCDDHDVCVVDLDDIINAPTIIPAEEAET